MDVNRSRLTSVINDADTNTADVTDTVADNDNRSVDLSCIRRLCDASDSCITNEHSSDAGGAEAGAVLPLPTSLKLASSALDKRSQCIRALEETLGLLDSILRRPSNTETTSARTGSLLSEKMASFGLIATSEPRPKSFLHDEVDEFNQIFSELVSSPQRRFHYFGQDRKCHPLDFPVATQVSLSASLPTDDDKNVSDETASENRLVAAEANDRILAGSICRESENPTGEPGLHVSKSSDVLGDSTCTEGGAVQLRCPRRHSDSTCAYVKSSAGDVKSRTFGSLDELEHEEEVDANKNGRWKRIYDQMNEEDADSGYQTGESSVLAMVSAARKRESTVILTREELSKRIEDFNQNTQGLVMSLLPDSDVFQGNIRVHMNIFRPIKMSLSSRPSSIYDILTRCEECLPQNEPSVASFRLPSNTFKAIHTTSETTTRLVIRTLLNKFNITDSPRKFALYERVLSADAKAGSTQGSSVSSVRRIPDDDRPLELCLSWANHGTEMLERCQFVLQENDPGDIMWEEFSLPELDNFLRILAQEEMAYVEHIQYKYRLLRLAMEKMLQDEQKTS